MSLRSSLGLPLSLVLGLLAACATAEGEEGDDEDSHSDDIVTNPNGANDTFQSFAALKAAQKEGVDFKITTTETPSNVLVLAIHGGSIEMGTSELARHVAAPGGSESPFDLYLFEGIMPSNNFRLHITSRRFDEPRALAMAQRSDRCLSLHGFKNPDVAEACLGGNDETLKKAIQTKLASFKDLSLRTSGGACDGLVAVEPENIVNRCKHAGVQLEMSSKWRKALGADPELRSDFAKALRAAVASVGAK